VSPEGIKGSAQYVTTTNNDSTAEINNEAEVFEVPKVLTMIEGPKGRCKHAVECKALLQGTKGKVSRVGLIKENVNKLKYLEMHTNKYTLALYVLKYSTNLDEISFGEEVCSEMKEISIGTVLKHSLVRTGVSTVTFESGITSECLENLLILMAKTIHFKALKKVQFKEEILFTPSLLDSYNYFMGKCGANLEYIELKCSFQAGMRSSNLSFGQVNFTNLRGIHIEQGEFSEAPENFLKELLRASTGSPIEFILTNLPLTNTNSYLLTHFHKTLIYVNITINIGKVREWDFGKCFGDLGKAKSISVLLNESDNGGVCSGGAIVVSNLKQMHVNQSLNLVEIKSKCSLVLKSEVKSFRFTQEGKYNVLSIQTVN